MCVSETTLKTCDLKISLKSRNRKKDINEEEIFQSSFHTNVYNYVNLYYANIIMKNNVIFSDKKDFCILF